MQVACECQINNRPPYAPSCFANQFGVGRNRSCCILGKCLCVPSCSCCGKSGCAAVQHKSFRLCHKAGWRSCPTSTRAGRRIRQGVVELSVLRRTLAHRALQQAAGLGDSRKQLLNGRSSLTCAFPHVSARHRRDQLSETAAALSEHRR